MSKTIFSIRNSLLNSKILQTDSEPEYTSEEIIFYQIFISKKSLKRAEIVSNENIEETFQLTYTVKKKIRKINRVNINKFTQVYNIKVVTDSLDYTIAKRYSEFKSLSDKV